MTNTSIYLRLLAADYTADEAEVGLRAARMARIAGLRGEELVEFALDTALDFHLNKLSEELAAFGG